MIDEEYVSPEVIREWFIKEPNKPYYKQSVLEYYQNHGWLNFGHTCWEDRKEVAEKLSKSHYLGFERGLGSIDFEKPIVDGGNPFYTSELELYHKDRYTKAMMSIPDILVRDLIYKIIIKRQKICLDHSNNSRINRINRVIRQLLCIGLDQLVEFYGGKQYSKRKVVGFSNVRVI